MSDYSQQHVRFAPDVVLQVIDGEALLLKLQDEVVFSLNETGARIAQLIAGGRSVEATVDALTIEYGQIREEVERDVIALVQALLARGLVVDRGSGAE